MTREPLAKCVCGDSTLVLEHLGRGEDSPILFSAGCTRCLRLVAAMSEPEAIAGWNAAQAVWRKMNMTNLSNKERET